MCQFILQIIHSDVWSWIREEEDMEGAEEEEEGTERAEEETLRCAEITG